MKNRFPISKITSLFVLILFLTSFSCFAQNSEQFSRSESPLPKPTGPVNDYAGVLDASTKQSIEKRLIDFRDRTNQKVELAVVIVGTTGERPIFEYSLAVARGWGIGSKEGDNPSALLFIAIEDRKYFTQISKDLEDELTDGVAGQLQRQYLVPAFKKGDYGKGVSDTIDAYIRTIEARQSGAPAPEASAETAQKGKSSGGGFRIVICLVILFIILITIFSRFGSNNRGGRGGGGGFGGGGGSALPFIIGTILGNSLGGSSSNSGWGGDSSSGGGDSWGGFGGGGDFGGGGSGGDW